MNSFTSGIDQSYRLCDDTEIVKVILENGDTPTVPCPFCLREDYEDTQHTSYRNTSKHFTKNLYKSDV